MVLRYPEALSEGRLIKRYKRFLADVLMKDGRTVVAHCGNPGSMMGLAEPNSRVFLLPNRNPTAKLAWRWEIASQTVPDAEGIPGEVLVGINTNLANRIVEAALTAGRIRALAGYPSIRREVKYGSRNSRIDFLLDDGERSPCYVEVKSVTLRRPDGPDPTAAQFPDAKTERGAKHLAELADLAKAGDRAVMLYLVQRADCTHVSLADDIDPAYAQAFADARAAGVEAICYDCKVTPEGIELGKLLPLKA